jgi:hypothetical protein
MPAERSREMARETVDTRPRRHCRVGRRSADDAVLGPCGTLLELRSVVWCGALPAGLLSPLDNQGRGEPEHHASLPPIRRGEPLQDSAVLPRERQSHRSELSALRLAAQGPVAPALQATRCGAARFPKVLGVAQVNVRFGWWVQPIAATHAANFSAGVW